jgi:hypothetical protein
MCELVASNDRQRFVVPVAAPGQAKDQTTPVVTFIR